MGWLVSGVSIGLMLLPLVVLTQVNPALVTLTQRFFPPRVHHRRSQPLLILIAGDARHQESQLPSTLLPLVVATDGAVFADGFDTVSVCF